MVCHYSSSIRSLGISLQPNKGWRSWGRRPSKRREQRLVVPTFSSELH
jgi:hypothetical protein